MVSAYRAQFDYIVLKPIWFLFLLLVGFSLYYRAWPMALFYVAIMFAIGYIGATLHKTLSYKELAAGTPSLSDAVVPQDPAELSHEDSHAVTSSCFRITFIIGVVASVLSAHNHSWGFSIFLGLSIWLLGAVVVAIIFGLVARQYTVGRLRSIPQGLFLFWLGVCVVTVPIGFIVRLSIV